MRFPWDERLLGATPRLIMRAHAAVAQLVEQRIRNAKVASSTPASGTTRMHSRGRFDPTRAFIHSSGRAVNKRVLLLLLAAPCLAFAEDDGDELLGLMQRPATSEVALAHIDDVRSRWDGSLFCIAKSNPDAPEDSRAAAFVAVKTYLENHPAERYRPRRYLIIQGLREAYPCAPR